MVWYRSSGKESALHVRLRGGLTLVDEAFEEVLVDVVVFDSLRHLLVEIPWFSRGGQLGGDLLVALGTEAVFVQLSAIVWAVPHLGRFHLC